MIDPIDQVDFSSSGIFRASGTMREKCDGTAQFTQYLIKNVGRPGSAIRSLVQGICDVRPPHARCSTQAHGVRGDAEKAWELYELAAVAGIEKARERLETLKSSSLP